jgi:gas vesicle protein
MKKLVDIVGKEVYESLSDEIKKEYDEKELIINDGTYIPKAKFDNLNEQKKDLENQLKETNDKMQELSKVDTEELKTQIADLQKKYEEDTKSLNEKYEAREYDIKLNDYAKDLKFSSNSAKKSFMSDLKAKELKFEDDKLVGFDDFVNSYKENDPTAFMEEKGEEPSVKVNTGDNHDDKENSDDAFINRIMGLN